MACRDKCELVDWWVSEVTTYSITEGTWLQAVGLRQEERDPPCPIQLTDTDVLIRVRDWLALEHGMTSKSTPCGRDCRCVRIGKWVVETTGTVRGTFDTAVFSPDTTIQGKATISFEAKVEKRRAPGTCVSVRLVFRPDLQEQD